MKNWLTRYYEWKLNRHRKLLEHLLVDPKSGVNQLVQNRSMELAMIMVMRWLDNKKIRHCSVCPSTEQIRMIGARPWCPGHCDEAQKVYDEHLKQESDKKALEKKSKSQTICNAA